MPSQATAAAGPPVRKFLNALRTMRRSRSVFPICPVFIVSSAFDLTGGFHEPAIRAPRHRHFRRPALLITGIGLKSASAMGSDNPPPPADDSSGKKKKKKQN